MFTRTKAYAQGEESSPTMTQDKYQLITDQLIQLIEQGNAPWRQPWFINKPKNLLTSQDYRGKNPLILQIQMMARGQTDPYFIGYQQAKEQGWQIIKGCKASWILFAGIATKKKDNDQEESYRICQWHKVFNVACIDDGKDGAEIKKRIQKLGSHPIESIRHDAAEWLWESTNPQLRSGSEMACYNPSTDTIHLPHKDSFISKSGYWATALHELVHWTGHHSRLNRELMHAFGTERYALEELIAEIGSAFLCNEIQISSQMEDHASYLSGWLKILKDDKKAFFKASSAAQKAADYLIDMAWPEIEENLHGADETLNDYALTRDVM